MTCNEFPTELTYATLKITCWKLLGHEVDMLSAPCGGFYLNLAFEVAGTRTF